MITSGPTGEVIIHHYPPTGANPMTYTSPPNGLALVHPHYEILTRRMGANRMWRRYFPPNTELRFRLLPGGVDAGSSFDSDGSYGVTVDEGDGVVINWEDGGTRAVNEWDVADATQTFIRSLSSSGGSGFFSDVTFSPDGSLMFVAESGFKPQIYTWTLSTPWVLSSSTLTTITVMPDTAWSCRHISFTPDGMTLFMTTQHSIRRFSLSGAWNLSSLTEVSSLDITPTTSGRGHHFRSDGLVLYVLVYEGLRRYDLTTAWDITTATIATTVKFHNQSQLTGVHVSDDGLHVLLTDIHHEMQVWRYDLSTAWDIESADRIMSKWPSGISKPHGVHAAGGRRFFVVGYTGARVIQYDIPTSVSANDGDYSDVYTRVMYAHSNPESQEAVVGGPRGDWTWYAENNGLFGVTERGWHKGLKNGYVDDEWILSDWEYVYYHGEWEDWDPHKSYDGTEKYVSAWLDDSQGHIETLDSEYAVAVYFKYFGYNWDYTGPPHPDDLSWGDNGQSSVVMAALLKREDNSLRTVRKDIPLGISWTDHGGDRAGLHLARLSQHELMMSYTERVLQPDAHYPDWYMYLPAVAVIRRVKDTVEVVHRRILMDHYTSHWYYSPRFSAAFNKVVALSDRRFLAIYESNFMDTQYLEVDYKGDPYSITAFNKYEGQGSFAVAACEWDGEAIQCGPPLHTGPYWAPSDVAAVSENMAICSGIYESRYAVRDQLKVPNMNLYVTSLFIRTLTINDDLTIVENLEGGVVEHSYIDSGGLSARVPVAAVNDGQQAIVMFPSAWPMQDSWDARDGSRELPFSWWEYLQYDHIFLKSGTTTRQQAGWFGSTIPATVPMTQLYDINSDGSLSKGERCPHVMDARPFNIVTEPAFADGDVRMTSRYVNQVSSLYLDDSSGRIFASWLVDQSDSVAPRPIDPLERVAVGTNITLDPNSRSGLATNSFRHLSVNGTIPWYWMGPGYLKPRRFPGTDYYASWIPPSTAGFVADGSIANMAEDYEGFPSDYFENFSSYTYETGYYLYQADHRMAYDYWEVTNNADYHDKFDKNPWNVMDGREWREDIGGYVWVQDPDTGVWTQVWDPSKDGWVDVQSHGAWHSQWEQNVDQYDVRSFMIWQIPPDPPQVPAGDPEVRVSGTKRRRHSY